MKMDLTQMLIVFDEQLPATNEEQGIYWFKSMRSDGFYVIVAFSIYEEYVDVILSNVTQTILTSISLKNCSEIRVLDEKRKCLEILHENLEGRCFISLLNYSVLEYNE